MWSSSSPEGVSCGSWDITRHGRCHARPAARASEASSHGALRGQEGQAGAARIALQPAYLMRCPKYTDAPVYKQQTSDSAFAAIYGTPAGV